MIAKLTALPFYAKLSLTLVGLIALGFLIIAGKDVLDPLMFGFLFAILLLPVSNFFERKCRLPRSAGAFLSILLFVFLVGGIMYLVATQISRLADDWPMLKKQIDQSTADAQGWIQSTFHMNMDKQMDYIHSTTSKLMSSGTSVIGHTFLSVSGMLLFFAFIIIFTFLIMFYRKLLFQFVLKAFGDEHEDTVHDIAENVQSILRQYILGLLLEMVIVAGIACTVFWIVGIRYAALLGIITGLFNIIPYVGIFTALALSTLITFATGALTKALIVAISVIAIHAVDANVLLPIIVGSKVRLNALITFLGILLGEMLWGLSGMFLSIPTIAIMKIIFDRIESLKPWGYLLGGDYEYKKSAEKKMKTE
ncbi:AI-2E family transporter [Mucilaginibacter sp. KACC 22063]|uniref:AI-2E family transporter n=1 Tax=Mucilaginibacter sp. KACC 22063 TaxID=3025666 RepID=UPI0023662ED3|nr:AI-2E family transporter [Mucilaginibacter sp. KACC 22063]WDF56600.1 AI-2E family transporter [Mucilaginibacter sp. KACC 22063]